MKMLLFEKKFFDDEEGMEILQFECSINEKIEKKCMK